jgi:DNA polymerase/3'-5' exonuclease PolX
MGTPDKPRFPLTTAILVAREIATALQPACARLPVAAGSLRRRKETVGDVEILYIPRFDSKTVEKDLFSTETVKTNLADLVIERLLEKDIIEKRINAKGSTMFGDKNKLVRHIATGLPIDLFSTTAACWENYLVCRTGSAESNTAIATRAKELGWKWNPYGAGFTLPDGSLKRVRCERDVFEFIGLPYKPPWER